MDLFGSFLVKDGRKEVKRYGALYACLSSRAIHIEVVHSMSTVSFIMSLRRFVIMSLRRFEKMDLTKIGNF